jgi:hypothetical protein
MYKREITKNKKSTTQKLKQATKLISIWVLLVISILKGPCDA